MIIYSIIIWAVILLFSVIPAAIIGCIFIAVFGDYGFWPGYVIGTIIFIIYMHPLWSLNTADLDAQPNAPVQKKQRNSLVPLLIGLLIGINIGD